MRQNLPEKPPERITYFDGYVLDLAGGTSGKYPTKSQRQKASRTTADDIRELLQVRQTIISLIVQMYAREPDAFDELKALTLKYTGSEQAADQMVNAVKAYRADWRTAMPVISSPQNSTVPAEPVDSVARFMKGYDADGGAIEAGFVPDETNIMLGQSLFITFTVINRTEKPYGFEVGGDNRGSVRHNSFRVTAAGADGQAVRDPYSYDNFGGFGGNIVLRPGQAYMERLNLGYWCTFQKPGVYTVTCERALRDEIGKSKNPNAPVKTSFELRITPATQR